MRGGFDAKGSPYEAVVSLGHCSGVLVQPRIVLTAAHCIDVAVDHVVVSGESLPVTGCQKYPRYEPDRAEHDIALCELGSPARVPPIPLEEGAALPSVGPVEMVGFGQTAPLAHASPERRAVSGGISGMRNGMIEVGDAEHTACRGDSGGPVLASHHGSRRVIGVVHGPAGAICFSPTQAVPIGPHREWLAEQHAYGSSRWPLGSWPLGILAVGILTAVLFGLFVVRRRIRSLRSAVMRA